MQNRVWIFYILYSTMKVGRYTTMSKDIEDLIYMEDGNAQSFAIFN